jgi:hypothetical protein
MRRKHTQTPRSSDPGEIMPHRPEDAPRLSSFSQPASSGSSWSANEPRASLVAQSGSNKAAAVENKTRVDLPCSQDDASMCAAGGDWMLPQGDSDMANRNALAQRAEHAAFANAKREIAALDELTVGELAEKYRDVFGVPTRTRNKDYLRRRIAWRIQAKQEGGLSPRALDRIEQLAPQAPARWHDPATKKAATGAPGRRSKSDLRDPRLPPPGHVLTRIHDGIEHRVTILSDGFEYRGEHHRSLSQVATLITGTPWNGFRFFFGNAHGGHAARAGGAE